MIERTFIPEIDQNVSRVAFGGSRLHYLSTEARRQELLETALDLGITHFDVAPIYGFGLAERSLGAFLAQGQHRRDQITIATKWGLPTVGWLDAVPRGLLHYGVGAVAVARKLGLRPSPISIDAPTLKSSVEASLRRLRTDHIDILWLHEPNYRALRDPDTLERAFEVLRRDGKVRAFGVAGYKKHVEPVATVFAKEPILWQCDEGEWDENNPPTFSFGAISQGPQSRAAPGISHCDAAERLRSALARRPRGVVLVSTTKPDNLRRLISEIEPY